MSAYEFHTVEQAIQSIKAGHFVIVADDEDRENEGDLVCAAEIITPDMINFMAREARGLICLPMSIELAEKLDLPLMTSNNTDSKGTAFTVSIDGAQHTGVGTGISAADRATTISLCMDENTKPDDLQRPGHVFPLVARPGGVLERRGQTEASVDLAKMAGFRSGGVICEIVNEDGSMARRDQLYSFSQKYNIPFVTVAQIIEYRLKNEILMQSTGTATMPTKYGQFTIHGYVEKITGKEHVVLTYGNVNRVEPILVRVHSECLTGDVFGSMRCDCNAQLDDVLKQIVAEGAGMLVYLRQEGRGIGIINKIKAYDLQDQGMDTFEANKALGFPEDMREYWYAAHILKDLNVDNIKLMTNNPDKIASLTNYGIKVHKRVASVHLTDTNKHYVSTKEIKHKHMISSNT